MESKLVSHSNNLTGDRPWKTILITGLIAGTLDALGAIIIYQAEPGAMFKHIASGAFGAGKAFSGGSVMVMWGVIFHYFIAYSWTILFFFLYPTSALLRRNKYVTGLLYGVFVWIMMNRVILPLSEIPQQPFSLKGALIGASILMVAIGLPIAIMTHRYYSRRNHYD